MAHVGFVSDDAPYVVPLAYGRDGDTVLVHGSTGSRAFRALADGTPACLTVTLLDGLVLARSAFETSMRYRSAMVLGCFARVTDPAAKEAALVRISEHSAPGRWADVRPPSGKELAATSVLTLPLDEWSVKVSDSWPEDEPDDRARPVWAGVIGFRTEVGPPQPAPDLRPGLEPPGYLWSLPAPGSRP